MLSRFAKNLKQQSFKDLSNAFCRALTGVAISVKQSQQNTEVRKGSHSLEVILEDGSSYNYPYIFLRDNCQCPKCFHPSTKQRITNTVFDIALDIQPKEAASENGQIHLTWADGHMSSFSHKWLLNRAFPKTESDIESKSKCGLIPELWDSKFQNNIPQYDFKDLITDEQATLCWMESIATAGLTIIKNAPAKSGILQNEIAKTVSGYLRKTHYGELFRVHQKEGPNNLAYTANFLPLHVDQPFYGYQPGVQLLHCIEQASGEGGENHYVDGFNVAAKMKKSDPEAFEILSTVKFMFNDIGADRYGEFNKKFERPIIGLDMFGNVESIGLNNHVRSSFINAPVEKVLKAYEAYFTLVQAMYEKENLITYKMKSGDIMTFNNQRVLHGRAAYKLTSSRLLEGCYFDWDEVYSSIRVLRKRLGLESL